MADEPVIRDCEPLVLEVEPGIHWWCSCGRSGHPPFCDGSHKGSGKQPVKFEVAETTTVRWCRCAHFDAPGA